MSDEAFRTELKNIWEAVKQENDMVSRVESLEESIHEIAKTIELKPELTQLSKQFLNRLGKSQEEFSVLTEHESYQELVNSIVHADISQFVARTGSTNRLQGTTINSERTHLHASGNSRNIVNDTTFQGTQGAVSMQGISTQGSVSVEGSGIGFAPGGGIFFGGNPNEVSGECPFCNKTIYADKHELRKFSQIECNYCHNVMPFKLPNA
ncbi:hypothetical protein [Vibrio coralliilyticus]|uniref:hypothetical protein n=1 Tax=Vibrio coralliilyticus TaxID=190893 RepID=UPI0020A4CEB4|nr:hypothetical protein [Vibrio coralliilyticus]